MPPTRPRAGYSDYKIGGYLVDLSRIAVERDLTGVPAGVVSCDAAGRPVPINADGLLVSVNGISLYLRPREESD